MTDDQLKLLLQEEAARVRLSDGEHMQMRATMQEFLEMKRVSASENTRQHKSMKNITAVLAADEKPALKNEEREAMREHLQRFMEQSREDRPVYEEESIGAFEWLASLLRGAFPRMAVIAGAFVLVGSGAAYAAEQSIPGGIFYPLKISVVEPLRGRLAQTDEEKANWEVQLAVRRLEEGEKLRMQNVLETSKVDIRERFNVHLSSASRHIEAVSRNDSARARRISDELALRLRAHEAVLGVIEVNELEGNPIFSIMPAIATGSVADVPSVQPSSQTPAIVPVVIAVPVVDVVPAAVVKETEKSIDVLKNVLKEVPVPAILRKSSKSSKSSNKSSEPQASSVFSSFVSSIIHSSIQASSIQSSLAASSIIPASSIPAASSVGVSSVAVASSVQTSSVAAPSSVQAAQSSQGVIDLPSIPIVDPVIEGLGL